MTEIFNLHTLCRCCHSDGSFKSLQLSYAYDNRIEVYSAMLKETLDITINPPPFEASYAICDCCINKLRDAAYFKQQVLECEQKFDEYCKNEQALIFKEEIDYESGKDSDLDSDVYNYNDEKHEICHDIKCDAKEVEVTANGVDDIDEKYLVKIKEEIEDAPKKPDRETNPIEYVEKGTKELVSEKSLTRNGLEVRVRRRKEINVQVDSELESHVKTENGDIYGCKTCHKTYKLLKALRNHILKQHKDIYKCQVCSLQCAGRLHYLSHKKIHPGETCKCHICGKSFRESSLLHQHLNKHTRTQKLQCDMCHKMFATKQTLKKHILWHNGENKTCMCEICGHAFNDTANLNSHIRAVHEKQRPFKCESCPKTFTAKKHLKYHRYTHTGEKPFKCDACVGEFVSPWKLKQHQSKHHSQSDPAALAMKLYTCKICSVEIGHRGKFLTHLKTHIGHKQYKCHLCTKDFTCKYSLNRHVHSHSGIKAYCCNMCDKKYTQQSQLCRHKKRIHDPSGDAQPGREVERVKCDVCNKGYRDIERHMRSHRTRPHVCEICSKSYPERNTLNRHILNVHQGIRRHPCTLCDKKYCKWSGLQKHTKRIHKLELKKEIEES